MDDLSRDLAREARRLDLNALNVDEADPDMVRAFAAFVLRELAARGLVEGESPVGCWAIPVPRGH